MASKRLDGGSGPAIDLAGSFRYGAAADGTPFGGTIDEMRLYPGVLSNAHLALDWQSQRLRNDFLLPVPGKTSVAVAGIPGTRMKTGALPGMPFFADASGDTIQDVPDLLRGRTALVLPRTASTSTADTLGTLALSGPAAVGVLIDDRTMPLPPFLSSPFAKKGTALVTDAKGTPRQFTLYERWFASACTLALSGPYSGGAMQGLGYALFLHLDEDDIARYVPGTGGTVPLRAVTRLRSGEPLFFDREYGVDSLAVELDGSVLISPSNSFKHDTSDGAVSFSVGMRSDVTLLVDSQTTALPAARGITGWRRIDGEVRAGGVPFALYRATTTHNSVMVDGIRAARRNGQPAHLCLCGERYRSALHAPSSGG